MRFFGTGGRGQPRNGGRGSASAKRSAGSIEAAARVAPNAPLSAGTTKAEKRASSRTNKKVKTGETASNVLWNSAGKGKGTADNGGVTNRGRISSISGDTQDLSALAKKFKERFGEEVASDDEDGETTQSSNSVFETPGRKRRFSGGAGPKSPVEEAAQSMSPAKLAAEVQKARARAREERFGGGGGSSLTTKTSPSARSSRSVPIGQPAAPAPRGTPPPARVSRIPPDHAATGQQQQQQGSHKKEKSTGFVAASASSPPQEGAAAEKGILPAAGAPKGRPLGEVAGTGDAVSASMKPRAVSPTSGARARFSAPPRSTTTTTHSSAPASSVVVRPDTEEVAKSTPGKTGRWSPAVVKAATTGETIPVDESPSPTVTSGAAPKRPAPDGGDGVVVEPPAKKVLASSKTQASPPSSPPLPQPPSQRQAAGATGGKIHTLRLRLRADLVTEPKQPAQMGPRATSGRAGVGGSSGVDECKGFEAPDPAPDAGVEECKGFDPPNLPLSTTSQHQQNAAPAPSPSASTKVTSAPPGGSTIASPDAVSRLSIAGDEGTPTSSTFAREGSWGPSFGIAGAGEERAIATPVVPATPARSPNVSVSKAPNPWILSAETPTFARNQGRPLAQSFPQPTTLTGRNSNSNSGTSDGENKRGSAGRAAGERTCTVAVVPSVAASSGSGGGSAGVRTRFGEPGSGITPAASNAPTVSSQRHSSSPTPGVGGARGSNVTDRVVEPRARLLSATSAGSNSQPLSVTQQGAAAGGAAAVAVTAEGGVGAATAAVAGGTATGVARGAGAPAGGQVVLGVHMSGRAGQLLDRLKREREESLDFERKLTQALLDL